MTDTLTALILFAVTSTLSPGGATSLATASGARFGYRRSLPLIAGIAGTLAALMAVSGTGLAAVIVAAPALALGMKIVGTLYLLWLAFSIARSGAPRGTGDAAARPLGFLGGAMLLAINPKAWAMATGVAASFAGMVDDPLMLAAILGGVFALAASLSLSAWAVAGSFLARVIRTDGQWRLVNGVLALLLALSILSFWR